VLQPITPLAKKGKSHKNQVPSSNKVGMLTHLVNLDIISSQPKTYLSKVLCFPADPVT